VYRRRGRIEEEKENCRSGKGSGGLQEHCKNSRRGKEKEESLNQFGEKGTRETFTWRRLRGRK